MEKTNNSAPVAQIEKTVAGKNLAQTLAQARTDHENHTEGLYETLEGKNTLKNEIDTALKQMNRLLYGNPHYKMVDHSPASIVGEIIVSLVVATVEIALNERGLECFYFSTNGTWLLAAGVGVCLSGLAFLSGLFWKRANVRKSTKDRIASIVTTLFGLAMLFAICQYRSHYMAEMATSDEAVGNELSVTVQMLFSGGIFMIGVFTAALFVKPTINPHVKDSFDEKRKELTKVKIEIAALNKEIHNANTVLAKKLTDAESDFNKKYKEEQKAVKTEAEESGTSQKQLAEKQILEGVVTKSHEQITFETHVAKFDKMLVDAEAITNIVPSSPDTKQVVPQDQLDAMSSEFNLLRLASVNYPTGKAIFTDLKKRFETIKNHTN